MKVLLVNPPRFRGLPVLREDRCEIVNRYLVAPPYSLLLIATALQARGHEVAIQDANGEDLSYPDVRAKLAAVQPEMVVFRFTPGTIEADMDTARLAREVCPGAVTVGLCWGLRSSAERVLHDYRSLDIYVAGDYGTNETIFEALADALQRREDLATVHGLSFRRNGSIVTTPPASIGTTYDPPLPAYDLLPPLDRYYINPKHREHCPFTIMCTSMGCPYSCIYCVVRRTPWRARPLENVLREIVHLVKERGVRCISFKDETFTLNRERTVALCHELLRAGLQFRWYASTRPDKVDAELLALMRRAGCRALSFGIESGSQTILDNIQKGITVEQALNAVKLAKQAGLWVHVAMMIGLPGENAQTLRETEEFIRTAQPAMAQFNTTVPYPGTPLYAMALQKGWWNPSFDYTRLQHDRSAMRTEVLTGEEILAARKRMYRKLYFNPRWVWSQFQNLEEAGFVLRYYAKCLGMFCLHGMRHSH